MSRFCSYSNLGIDILLISITVRNQYVKAANSPSVLKMIGSNYPPFPQIMHEKRERERDDKLQYNWLNT